MAAVHLICCAAKLKPHTSDIRPHHREGFASDRMLNKEIIERKLPLSHPNNPTAYK
jgi:hypothetical protein